MSCSVKCIFEIYEDMVQILLILKVLFTLDSEVENLFCDASPSSEPSLFFSNNLSSFGFAYIQDDFQHDFTWMTDEADGSVVLAELKVSLLREFNNQLLSLFSRICDKSLLKPLSWSPHLLEQVLLVYY